MKSLLSRRSFLKTGAAWSAAGVLGKGTALFSGQSGAAASGRTAVVASFNGLKATEKAMELLSLGTDPLEAVIAGVNIVEEDPEDTSVGYGGLPNEEGVVELDASVMYGPTHSAGAVAGLRNIKTPSKVARLVMERSDHVLLVGEGALKFAKAHGFQEENLLTDKAREAWLHWKETLSEKDDWLPTKKKPSDPAVKAALHTYGTINCIAIDQNGSLAGVTTTSGLSYKIPGRVGDSPIIGAGLYVDNDIGAAGSTGRGEANLQTCGSYLVVDYMDQGFSPEESCLKALAKIVAKSKLQPYLLNEDGLPRFNVTFYAINKKGDFGSASIWSENQFAVHDGKTNQLRDSAYLYVKKFEEED